MLTPTATQILLLLHAQSISGKMCSRKGGGACRQCSWEVLLPTESGSLTQPQVFLFHLIWGSEPQTFKKPNPRLIVMGKMASFIH